MSENNNFYITTTLPYTNAHPHIGHATEFIKADVIARYQSLLGKKVIFNTGTDEHGLKIQEQAELAKLSPRDYSEQYATSFKSLKEVLNLSFTHFIRTSDENHQKAVQAFWQLCSAKGDIYKKSYKIKYCVGCEMEKTDSELENGLCPLHPNKDLEIIDEENYFFRFSKYQQALLDFYDNHTDFVVPSHRFKEIRNFVAAGLQDFSISRLKSKMSNGVAVPGDDEQVMYVWFDALVNYISTLDWPNSDGEFKDFWPAVQVCGKDNLRQQTAMWQAMLMSAGILPSKQVLIFGFLTNEGKKMSKSLGNVIDPVVMVEKYGTEALRYYLLSDIPVFEDGDFSENHLILKYNSDLANGLGNLVSRLSNLLEKNSIETNLQINQSLVFNKSEFKSNMEKYQFNKALQFIWHEIAMCNENLSTQAPWKMKDVNEIAVVLKPLAQQVLDIAIMLQPFLPSTATQIINLFTQKQITKSPTLFPRLNLENN